MESKWAVFAAPLARVQRAQLRPVLGLRPWFALLRRALAFRFWVRLDMVVRLSVKFEPDSGRSSRGVACCPGEQVLVVPGVDDVFDRHAAPHGLVGPVRLPFQLPGGMSIAVDGDLAAPLHSDIE